LNRILVLFDLIYTQLSVVYLPCLILKLGCQQIRALAVSLSNRRLEIIRPVSSFESSQYLEFALSGF
jgi:hypothetical protein